MLARGAAGKGIGARYLYSDKVDPTSTEFEAEPQFHGEPRTMVDAINHTLHEEMRRDERIVVFGEDVADCSREENLRGSEGQGRRLQSDRRVADSSSGRERCFNTPLAEAAHHRPRHRHGRRAG